MSIEEKAKAYDEAIKRVENIKTGKCETTFMFTKGLFEYIFPELAKSEDERIRKAIINVFAAHKDYEIFFGVSVEDILAWLEKQGEIIKEWSEIKFNNIQTELQNMVDLKRKIEQGEQRPSGCLEYCVMSNCSNCPYRPIVVKQKPYVSETIDEKGDFDNGFTRMMEKEKNPAWSEDDEKQLQYAIAVIQWYTGITDIITWLISLKDRMQPQQEWSDVDKDILFRTIDSLKFLKDTISTDPKYAVNIIDIEREITWLKSLRPQNNITDEELAQAKKDAYNDVLDKLEYDNENPTFDDGWSAAIWYLKKRNAQPHNTWKPSDEQMITLRQVISGCSYDIEPLVEIEEYLKKLKE